MKYLILVSVALGLNGFQAKAFDLDDEGFYLPTQLPEGHRPQNLDRALGASIRLQMGFFGSCSGSFLTHDGYVLTASHCIESCLTRNGKIKNTESKKPTYATHEVLDHHPGIQCGEIGLSEYGLSSPTVVAVGSGFVEYDDGQILEISKKVREKFAQINDDWAILKFDTSKASKPVSCIPGTEKKSIDVGEKIWAVGFPGANKRKNGFSSNGRTEFVSYGTVYADVSRNELYSILKFSLEQITALVGLYSSPGNIISNMDTYPGNSGSMAIDENGELIGVNTALAVPEISYIQNRFLDGLSASVTLPHIRTRLQEIGVTEEEAGKIFNCYENDLPIFEE